MQSLTLSRSAFGARVGALLCGVLCALRYVVTPAHAQPVFVMADTAALHRQPDHVAADHHGVLGYSVDNLQGGAALVAAWPQLAPLLPKPGTGPAR
jgi:hypothetical protein